MVDATLGLSNLALDMDDPSRLLKESASCSLDNLRIGIVGAMSFRRSDGEQAIIDGILLVESKQNTRLGTF